MCAVCAGIAQPVSQATAPHLQNPSAATEFLSLDSKVLQNGNSADTSGHIRKVEQPVLHFVRTPVSNSVGTVLLIPGGGYSLLAAEHEGTATAKFLSAAPEVKTSENPAGVKKVDITLQAPAMTSIVTKTPLFTVPLVPVSNGPSHPAPRLHSREARASNRRSRPGVPASTYLWSAIPPRRRCQIA